jgi:oligopeptide/dipeptide ABC transporter ATP-binding protein
VVSALDVSIQGQILNLLLDIQRKNSTRDLSFLFIAHDLKVASYFCDRIGVMYRGELMEEAPADKLYLNARHPYTKLLFSAVSHGIEAPVTPVADSVTAEAPGGSLLRGEVDTALSAISGCAFSARCPLADERCVRERPEFRSIHTGLVRDETSAASPGQNKAQSDHLVRCWKA